MNPLTQVKNTQKATKSEILLGLSESASWHARFKHSAYVFVGGLDYDLTEGDVLAVFAQYGEVVDVHLVRDKATGKSRGFSFLAYEDQRSTVLAVDNLSGAKVAGRIVRVEHVDNYKKKKAEMEGEDPNKVSDDDEPAARPKPEPAELAGPGPGSQARGRLEEPSGPVGGSIHELLAEGARIRQQQAAAKEAAAAAAAAALDGAGKRKKEKKAKKEKKEKREKKEKHKKKKRESSSSSSSSDTEDERRRRSGAGAAGAFGPPKPAGREGSFGPPKPPGREGGTSGHPSTSGREASGTLGPPRPSHSSPLPASTSRHEYVTASMHSRKREESTFGPPQPPSHRREQEQDRERGSREGGWQGRRGEGEERSRVSRDDRRSEEQGADDRGRGRGERGRIGGERDDRGGREQSRERRDRIRERSREQGRY